MAANLQMKIVFLVSGGGGHLRFFFHAVESKLIAPVSFAVVSDRECSAAEFANERGIECRTIRYKKDEPDELIGILTQADPDVIVTNWHKIIDKRTVDRFRGRLVNLHYSLLPAFGGLIGMEPLDKAYAQGCRYVGPTCHLVDEGVDSGKIISQAVFETNIPIEEAKHRMFRTACLVLLSAVQVVAGKNLTVENNASGNAQFSPRLNFDERVFDEAFWQRVAKA